MGDTDINCNCCAWNGPQRLEEKFGGIGRKNRDPPDLLHCRDRLEYCEGFWRAKVAQISKVSQIPEKDHQLTLV